MTNDQRVRFALWYTLVTGALVTALVFALTFGARRRCRGWATWSLLTELSVRLTRARRGGASWRPGSSFHAALVLLRYLLLTLFIRAAERRLTTASVRAGSPLAVYPAMLAGTMAGQLLGMVVDAPVLRTRFIGLPLACSVAAGGARRGALRGGAHGPRRSRRPSDARLSIDYSLALAGVSVPLARVARGGARLERRGAGAGRLVG